MNLNLHQKPSFNSAHVIGLQRTGTNFVSELLRQSTNLIITPSGDRSLFWKHAHPCEGTASESTARDVVAAHPDTLFILVSKHPLHFLESVKHGNPQDFFLTAFRGHHGQIDDYAILKKYFEYYADWLDEFSRQSNLVHFRYEHCLARPSSEIFQRLKQVDVPSWPRKLLPARVPYSGTVRAWTIRKYLRGRPNNSDIILEEYFAREMKEVAFRLGYQIGPPRFSIPTVFWRFSPFFSR